MDIQRGQRVKIADLAPGGDFVVGLNIAAPGLEIDFSCFGLDAQEKLSDERYMTFFNQPRTPCGGVALETPPGDRSGFAFSLQKLPASIERLVIAAAIDGLGAMSSMIRGHARILAGGAETARFDFAGTDFQAERALMLVELYRKDGIWRLSATGQGFNGGLEALVRHFGGTVAEAPSPTSAPTPAAAPAAPAGRISLEKKFEGQPAHLLSLAKKAAVSLEKKRLTEVRAQVCLVLDASGSMIQQYEKGRVQEVADRLLPLAVHFDDDGALDCWIFADRCKQLPAVSLNTIAGYIQREAPWAGGFSGRPIGGGNNEPCVIKAVMERFRGAKLPAYVLFVSDGGVYKNREIEKLIVEAARLPIFWQFVGIGGGNYGVLEKLDNLSGRVVDNCDFFALDDLRSISESELYDRMLEEFPSWLRAARSKSILS
jgi:stress response protein SCP2